MKLMLLGAPGSGKGTLAGLLCEATQYKHISTGDIFRAAIKNQTPLGKQVQDILASGKLVPDELTCQIVFDRLRAEEQGKGYILDGFPRTQAQAEALDAEIELDHVVLLELDEETNIQRLTQRLICPDCGAIYHQTNKAPKVEGVCDNCGAKPVSRPDDHPDVVHKRLNEYNMQTSPLINHYEAKGKLRRFSALKSPDEILQEVRKSLGL